MGPSRQLVTAIELLATLEICFMFMVQAYITDSIRQLYMMTLARELAAATAHKMPLTL